MNHFMINGIERPSPFSADENLGTLIHYVQQSLSSETQLVSSIRVDGIEIFEEEEKKLSTTNLSQIGSVEVVFSHPKEIAEETLQMLIPFTERLMKLSRGIAGTMTETQTHHPLEFEQLMDGLQTFSDSITSVKRVLRVTTHQKLQLLEVDLLSILQDLCESFQKHDRANEKVLLAEHLPAILQEWIKEGIPALIRCRDS